MDNGKRIRLNLANRKTEELLLFSRDSKPRSVYAIEGSTPFESKIVILHKGFQEELTVGLFNGELQIINKNMNVRDYTLVQDDKGEFSNYPQFRRNSGPLSDWVWYLDGEMKLDSADKSSSQIVKQFDDNFLIAMLDSFITVTPLYKDNDSFVPVAAIVDVRDENPFK